MGIDPHVWATAAAAIEGRLPAVSTGRGTD